MRKGVDPTGLAPVVKEVELGGRSPLNVGLHRRKAGGRHDMNM